MLPCGVSQSLTDPMSQDSSHFPALVRQWCDQRRVIALCISQPCKMHVAQLSKPVCQLHRVFSPTAQKSQLSGEKTGEKPEEENTGQAAVALLSEQTTQRTFTGFKTARTADLTDLKTPVLIQIHDF